jgi:hypothetical protein
MVVTGDRIILSVELTIGLYTKICYLFEENNSKVYLGLHLSDNNIISKFNIYN